MQFFFRSESDIGRLLRRFLEDSQKTLGRLLGKSSNVFYSGSLPKSSVQSGTKEWCKVDFKLIYVEEWYLAPCVIVLFMVCLMIFMCTILVLNFL